MLISLDPAEGLSTYQEATTTLLSVAAFVTAIRADPPDGRIAAEQADRQSNLMALAYLAIHNEEPAIVASENSSFPILISDINYCSALVPVAAKIYEESKDGP